MKGERLLYRVDQDPDAASLFLADFEPFENSFRRWQVRSGSAGKDHVGSASKDGRRANPSDPLSAVRPHTQLERKGSLPTRSPAPE